MPDHAQMGQAVWMTQLQGVAHQQNAKPALLETDALDSQQV